MKLKSVLLSFLMLCSSVVAYGENVSDKLVNDVTDSKTLDLFPALPPVNLPPGMTAHSFMLVLAAAFIIFIFWYGLRNVSLKPKGVVVMLESLVLFVRDDIVFPIMGEKRGERWVPFFCSLFLFLLVVNLLGLIPAFKTATGDINVTTALASIIFVLVFAVGLKNLGPVGFFKNFYPKDIIFPVGIFVAVMEFIGLFIKITVLSLRLFANMFAGHLAIISFLMMMFVLNPLAGSFAVPFAVFTYIIEVIICLIQALVFTLLSCIFITMTSTVNEH